MEAGILSDEEEDNVSDIDSPASVVILSHAAEVVVPEKAEEAPFLPWEP